MDARLCRNGSKRSVLPFDVGLIGQRSRELVKQLLRLFGEDVFDQRLDVDIVQSVGGGEMRVGVGALRQQIRGICGWILWYRRLDSLDGEPVR